MSRVAVPCLTACLLSAAACGGDDDGSGPSDGGHDAGVAADAAPTIDAGLGCDVGTPPVDPPPLDGDFVFHGGDGGVEVPVPMGGEVRGVWVFDRVTFYVSDANRDQLDAESSSVAGDAWTEMGETDYRLELRLDVTLETLVVGTVRRDDTFRSKGTYTVDGGGLVLESECFEGGNDGELMLVIGFTESGGEGQLILETEGASGTTYIVLEGTRNDGA